MSIENRVFTIMSIGSVIISTICYVLVQIM